MTDYTSQAIAALARVECGEPLTELDQKIIAPLLQKTVESGRIPFIKRTDGYLIGAAKRSSLKGVEYCRIILMRAPCEVRAIDVVATGQQEGDKATDDTIDVPVSPGSFRGVGVSQPRHEVYDWRAIREVRAHMRELQALDTAEAYEELESLREIFGRATFHGKSRSFADEAEKARQSVTQAIRYALRRLVDDPETQAIGAHLRQHIRTGFQCSYDGEWKWKF